MHLTFRWDILPFSGTMIELLSSNEILPSWGSAQGWKWLWVGDLRTGGGSTCFYWGQIFFRATNGALRLSTTARQKRLGLWRLHDGYDSPDGSTVTSVHERKFSLGLAEGCIQRTHNASASIRIENRKACLDVSMQRLVLKTSWWSHTRSSSSVWTYFLDVQLLHFTFISAVISKIKEEIVQLERCFTDLGATFQFSLIIYAES